MENKVSFFGNAVKYGVILGLASVFISLLVWLSGVNIMANFVIPIVVGLIGITLTIVFFRLGVVKFREALGGKINFGQAVATSMVVGLVSVLFSIIYSYIQNHILDPMYVESMIEGYLEMMEKFPTVPEDQIIQQVENFEKMKDAGYMAIQNLKNGVIMTAIVSLLVAAFIKKDTTSELV